MLTAMITSYNEEKRIDAVVRGALCWADEVLVIDKSSTDKTAQIASDLGARVVAFPFRRQGDDPGEEYVEFAKYDWVLWLTSGEQLTPSIARLVRLAIKQDTDQGSATDIIYLPVKLFAFGHFFERPKGPWSVSYQPRLLNRKRARHTGAIHNHWVGSDKSLRINFDDQTYLLHPTHATFERYIQSHLDYAIMDASQATDKLERARQALQEGHVHDLQFDMDGPDAISQKVAWHIYHYMIVLACLEELKTEKPVVKYQRLVEEHLLALETDKGLK